MAPRVPPSSADRTLTASQLANAAETAGFSGEDELITIVAIALAESGGDADAINRENSDGSSDYGAWQINSVHADLFERHPNWWEPAENAKMARSVYLLQGFRAWTVYKSGAYKSRIEGFDGARNGVKLRGIAGKELRGEGNIIDDVFGLANGVLGIAQSVFKAGAWLADPRNWQRVAFVVTGGALVVGALVLVARK